MSTHRPSSFVAALSALFILLSCATVSPQPPAPAPQPANPAVTASDGTLWTIYSAAVEAAKFPEPGHISRDLVPIVRSNPHLTWDDNGRVLMVTWTKKAYYAGKEGQPYALPKGVTMWLTAVPYIQRACQSWDLPPDRLPLRIAQAIGTPPPKPGGNDSFVQVWADSRTFFRPCPDPEITDRECQATLNGRPVNKDAGCPWTTEQLSAAYVKVSDDHLAWMCKNWSDTYLVEPQKRYPWTALGYTFDWGDLLHPVGQSEYVVLPETTVWVDKIFSADEYCH